MKCPLCISPASQSSLAPRGHRVRAAQLRNGGACVALAAEAAGKTTLKGTSILAAHPQPPQAILLQCVPADRILFLCPSGNVPVGCCEAKGFASGVYNMPSPARPQSLPLRRCLREGGRKEGRGPGFFCSSFTDYIFPPALERRRKPHCCSPEPFTLILRAAYLSVNHLVTFQTHPRQLNSRQQHRNENAQ